MTLPAMVQSRSKRQYTMFHRERGPIISRITTDGPAEEMTVIKDNINWRRHRLACPFYREDWKVEDGLYRCICLMGTPPETRDEQDRCMKSRTRCWRTKKKPSPKVAAPAGADIA